MAITNYHTVNGEIIGETTSAVRTGYLTDGLGSVTATQGSTGSVLATYRYKPYGALLAKTGAGSDPQFMWLGSAGYRWSMPGPYVRARHMRSSTAKWTTLDTLWPKELPFAYCAANPTTLTDPSGLHVSVIVNAFKKSWACGNFTMDWTMQNLTVKDPLYLVQLIDIGVAGHDCVTKQDMVSKKLKPVLEAIPFEHTPHYNQTVRDEFAMNGPRSGGRTWNCTKGSYSFVAKYEVVRASDYPMTLWGGKYPPAPSATYPWEGVAPAGGYRGFYQILPFNGSFPGKSIQTRKVTYKWNCCLKKNWYKLTATAPGMTTATWEEGSEKGPVKKCPEVKGASGAS